MPTVQTYPLFHSMARWLLPEGISDVLPLEARHVERLRRSLLDLYASYGYQYVIPPLVEYLDSLLTGTGRDLNLRTFKLTDQLSGRQLGLRADITPQTARIDAHILNRRGVVRLCYAGSVLHTRPAHALATRQPIQVGAELYGSSELAADIEVQRLAIESLQCAGVQDVRIDFGHTGILRCLLQQDAALNSHADEVLAALNGKDLPALQQLASALTAPTAQALIALASLHGEPQEILTRAHQQLPRLPEIARALNDLSHLVEQAGNAGAQASIDLSDLHGYRYYSGVNFAAYAPDGNDALLRGGRYDDIGRAFGRARPTSGFSIDLRELTRRNGQLLATAILAPLTQDPIQSTALAIEIKRLRAAGEMVVQQLSADEVLDSIEVDRVLVWVDSQWTVVPRTAVQP